MRTYCFALLLAAMAVAFSGCGTGLYPRVPVKPGPGFIFASYQAPLMVNYDKTKVSKKHGEAWTYYIYEPFLGTSWSWGDASIEAAAAKGGVKTVNHADYKWLGVLGMFGQFTVTAYGE